VQLACTLHLNPQASAHKSLEARDHIKDNPRIDRAFAVIDPLSGFLWIAPRHLNAISMPLSFWIAVVTSAAILFLCLLRTVRLREIQVLNKLGDRNGLPGVLQFKDQQEKNKRPVPQGEKMSASTPTPTSRSIHGIELRRSSRIQLPVPLLILGTNRRGETFQERTSAVSVNLHGCRYSSRHEYVQDGWVTLQVTGTDGPSSPAVRARVRSVFSARTPRELCQVGVELDTPGNVWGISTPPEDWQRLLGGGNSSAGTAAAVAPAKEASTPISSFQGEQPTAPERRAEVTVFPGQPIGAAPVGEVPPATEPAPAKPERLVITSEQILQALKGQIRLAADRAVQASLSTQLDPAVKLALAKIEEGSQANVRQIEKSSVDRMAEMQNLWEKQLVANRGQAQEISSRLQALADNSQQTLAETQKSVERLANETSPQLHARLMESFDRASIELNARATEVFAQHLARLDESSQLAAREARSQLNDSVAETRSLISSAGGGVSLEQVESLLHSSSEQTLGRLEERLAELRAGFEQRSDLVGHRIDDLARQLESLGSETSQARSQHELDLSGVRSFLVNANAGVTQEHLESLLGSSREKILSVLEWRLGEVSAHYERLFSEARNSADKLAEQVEKLSSETRDRLTEARSLADRASRELRPQDPSIIGESLSHATKEFETAAARVSDRELVRLIEQKQALSREVSLELEARTSEARALLQKSANSTLEEFRRSVELQIDLILAEAKERVTSSIASLDAESRAAIEARRRALEADVARAAEQSTMEFRSGIKAFLYSCLVAAVGAVDQHVQTTLAGLAADPGSMPRPLDATGGSSPKPGDPPTPPNNVSPQQ
jgi:hypothetical protein